MTEILQNVQVFARLRRRRRRQSYDNTSSFSSKTAKLKMYTLPSEYTFLLRNTVQHSCLAIILFLLYLQSRQKTYHIKTPPMINFQYVYIV